MGLLSSSLPPMLWVLQAGCRENGHILIPFQGSPGCLPGKQGREKEAKGEAGKKKPFHNEDWIFSELNCKIRCLL